jgi:hypothetical protein
MSEKGGGLKTALARGPSLKGDGSPLTIDTANLGQRHPALQPDQGKGIEEDMMVMSPDIKHLLKRKMVYANYMSKIQTSFMERLKQNPLLAQLLKRRVDGGEAPPMQSSQGSP